MKVLVTGGTGFVGAHAVAAMVRAGHDVRVLARRPAQMNVSLAPLGVQVEDVVMGDVLDEAAVLRALAGCQAVVHAAAIYSLDPRRAEDVRRTNVRAADLVLNGAVERGLDPVVHISSTVALTRYGGSGAALPLGDIDLPYARSKIDSEQVSRGLAAEGAPVVSIYPGAVYGPDDPYRGDQGELLRWILLGRFPLWPAGGMHVTDVRDTAAVIAAALQPGRGPGRYVVPGHHVDGALLYGTVAEVTGRRLPHLVVPGPLMARSAWLIGSLQRSLPKRWHYPADREGVEIVRRNTRFDDAAAREAFGIPARPFASTISDTVRWLLRSGRVPPRYGGRLSSV